MSLDAFGNEFCHLGNEFPHFGGNEFWSKWAKKKPADLANKPRNMIFPHPKFGINRTPSSKVMTKKFLWPNLNFLAITFEAAV